MTRGITMDTGCNLSCEYCYEHPSREIRSPEYDVESIINSLDEWKNRWENDKAPGLHGGEPMLIPDDDMELFFDYINSNWDDNPWIQTNGSLIQEHHIEMFKEYNVHVGISCDGPGELNDKRIAKSDNTREITEKTISNIFKLREEGVGVGVIVVVHNHNAGTDEKLNKLLNWIVELNDVGISGHYNPGRAPSSQLELTPKRYGEVLIQTWNLLKQSEEYSWNPVRRMQDALLYGDNSSCTMGKCDPRGTEVAKCITGDGSFTGCARMWPQLGDGNPFLQGPSNNDSYGSWNGRYDLLKQLPQDSGGCNGCEYWGVCYGGCPGNGKGTDYRKKTYWCESYKMLYDEIKSDMKKLFPNMNFKQENPNIGIFADIKEQCTVGKVQKSNTKKNSFEWEGVNE